MKRVQDPTLYVDLFGLASALAERASKLVTGELRPEDEPERFPLTLEWMKRCHHTPADELVALEAISELVGLAVEGHCNETGTRGFSYINMGDSYARTVGLKFRAPDTYTWTVAVPAEVT